MGASTKANVVRIAVLLSILHLTSTAAVHEVHEIVNEQARSDDGFKPSTGHNNLPYGNPLAGNSLQNARLHAQNQQAMFNAERMRQHRAQVQRWSKALQPMDSYVKAFQESQDNHQLALEQQQASATDKKPVTTSKPQPKSRHSTRPEALKRGIQVIPEILKTSKADVEEKVRNHRSYGSIRYRNRVQPKAYKSVYLSAGPTYDQGVTIKPNGNIGLASLKSSYEDSKLFTSAIPSKTRHVFPKQFRQMQGYESAKDIEALSALLKKSPPIQMSEFNSLVSLSNTDSKSVLDTPIDLFFYMNDKPYQTSSIYDHTYAEAPPTYASAYMPVVKDHIPIKEDVIDIENPNKGPKKPYTLEPLTATALPLIETTIKTTNFYNLDVTTQIPEFKPTADFLKQEEKVKTYAYDSSVDQYFKSPKLEGDLSEPYLHHNAKHHGVTQLAGDGTGISAYGDDSLHYAANYEFGYRVRDFESGNYFGHQEAQKGGKTSGQYHVLLPDGRIQNVQYSAGPEGFHADISYDHLKTR